MIVMPEYPIFVKASEPIVKNIVTTLSQMFGNENVERVFAGKTIYITRGVERNELFLVSANMESFVSKYIKGIMKKEPYSLGLFLGQIVKGKYEISMDIAEKLFIEAKRNAIMVNDHASALFLYGRDIMAKSILKVYPPLSRIVVVVNRFEDFLGLCKLTVKPKELLSETLKGDEIVCLNVIDKGWFLRKGR